MKPPDLLEIVACTFGSSVISTKSLCKDYKSFIRCISHTEIIMDPCSQTSAGR